MKRFVLICLLFGCGMLALAATQCGGDTSTTTGTVLNGDGGTQTTPPPSGW